MNQDNTQLDPTIVNMARAIKNAETGGHADPYTAKGASGEYGAYQYTPSTWASDSAKYLGQSIPLEGASIEQQNKVAYGKIKDLKDQGNNPLQVASIWNSGKPDPTGNVGINSYGAKYDTPAYVNKVVNAYNSYKSGFEPSNNLSTTNTTANQEQDPSLGQELSSRLKDAGTALTQASNGQINPISGVIQAAGAAGGALGDVINKGLELVPGVKFLENQLGQGISSIAKTPEGQAVVKSIQSFQQAHPELSSDIGAGFNIVTAIPILKGLGTVAGLAKTGLAGALEGIAEKGFIKDIGGRGLINDGTENVVKQGILNPQSLLSPKTIQSLTPEELSNFSRNVPDIAEGKYITENAQDQIQKQISIIAEKELQPVLDQASTKNIADRLPLEQVRKDALEYARLNLQDVGPVNNMFDKVQGLYGDAPSLAEWNKAKQLISGQIPAKAFDVGGYNANLNARQTIQKAIEDGAKTLGLDDVNAINAKMRKLYQAKDILENLNGKKVRSSLTSKILRKSVSTAAAMVAGQLGAGPIGEIGIGLMTDTANKGLLGAGPSFRNAVLKRTAQNAVKPTVFKTATRSLGLLGGVAAQKLNNISH